MGFRILTFGAFVALVFSSALGQETASQPIVVVPPAVVPMVSSPIVTTPIVTTPSVHFENGTNGTTIPVVTNSAVVTQTALPQSASPTASSSAAGSTQTADLNLGNVSSVSELYGGDNRGVAEVSRQYKARRNGVQNARVYTNADIDRIRAQAGEGRSATPANDQQATMPASDQSAEQNNQATTPQVQQPANNQKPSPFAPKK